MANNEGGLFSCRNTCWIVGALLGLAVALLVGLSIILKLIIGIIVAVVVALVLQKLFCVGTATASRTASSAPRPAAPAKAAATTTAEPAAAAASSAGQGNPDAAAVKPTAAVEASAAAQDAEATPAEGGTAATKAADVAPAAKVSPSKPLAGQMELSERKGTWTYEKPEAARPAKDSVKKAPSKKAPAKKAPAAKAKPAAAATGGVAGTLGAPRGGQPDDLKMLKGVGPKIEAQLHAHGIYHFDQVAQMSAAEITWLDEQLVGTSARQITGWQPDARALAAGEETAFSQKAKTSGLYEDNKKK